MKTIKSLISLMVLLLLFRGCSDESTLDTHPFIVFRQGDDYVTDGARIPVGGQMTFGISAVGDGSPITYLRIKRITGDQVTVELDRGLYQESGGLDTVFYFVKGPAEEETWNFFIMNENRDTASVNMTILKGEGSGYGPIRYHPSITIGFQGNGTHDHYLDLDDGVTYSPANIGGNEQRIDIIAYFYYTSGNPSPTLACPAYTSAVTYYPEFVAWPARNATLYDYYTVDNDLITPEQFDAAENDSLLVTGYRPESVSGNCKYCYTGKIIPFKTAQGKYGLIKVIRADQSETGSMEIAVKIQE